jgi:hypothetical protein
MFQDIDKNSAATKWFSCIPLPVRSVFLLLRYKQLAEQTKMPTPKAIVVVRYMFLLPILCSEIAFACLFIFPFSAHWETEGTVYVTSQDKHSTLFYDYYGFPTETYELKYPSPGSPALAKQIVSLLTQAGFEAEEDKERNLDHVRTRYVLEEFLRACHSRGFADWINCGLFDLVL